MKICPKCHYGNYDTDMQCRYCGNQLPFYYPKKKTEGTDILGVAIIIIAIIFAIADTMLLFSNAKSSDTDMLGVIIYSIIVSPIIIPEIIVSILGYTKTRQKHAYYKAAGINKIDVNKIAMIVSLIGFGYSALLRIIIILFPDIIYLL